MNQQPHDWKSNSLPLCRLATKFGFTTSTAIYRVGQQNDPTCFCQNFVKSLPNLIIFGTQNSQKDKNYLMYTHCPSHLIYVDALPCKTQMRQIVTLRGDYQYQIAYLFIINLT